MEPNLLTALRKYSPKEELDPLENFVTEAFCWLLSNDEHFSSYFIRYLFNKEIFSGKNITAEDFLNPSLKWSTQYNLNGVRPDMICEAGNAAIIFEHKVWSELADKQLENYREGAKKNFEHWRLVFIAGREGLFPNKGDTDLSICWSDVHKMIGGFLKEKQESELAFMCRSFQHLLESEGMGPPAPVSHEAIMSYLIGKELEGPLKNLLKLAYEKNKSWLSFIESVEGTEKRFDEVKEDRWGRYGIQLISLDSLGWNPGIFVGVLLDGSDHYTKPLNKHRGPDFCLIFSMAEKFHGEYPSCPHYLALVDAVEKRVAKLGDGWCFYDQLNDPSKTSRNKWHPLHIRKPLLDVLAGTKTADDQVEKINEAAELLIKGLAGLDEFKAFRKHYQALVV